MTNKKQRIIHSAEFKAETLKLAQRIGVSAAAKQLSLQNSQIYAWRKAAHNKTSSTERENNLATENARLKRLLADQAEELEILKKAATYFAKKIK